MLDQLQAAEAAHRVDDVHQQRLGDCVARVRDQRVDDLLGVVARSARIPQRERRDPVGVDVLGSTFEFGERCDRLTSGLRIGVVDLEQQRFVGLHDQGPSVTRSIVQMGAVIVSDG